MVENNVLVWYDKRKRNSMREIKFRAYSKESFTYFDLDLLNDESRAFYINEIEDNQVMQYTGLKDKNDVEIYEGDIVKGNYLRGIGVVEWNKYFCKFDISHRMNISPSDEFEVIGNIYENKELLKSPSPTL